MYSANFNVLNTLLAYVLVIASAYNDNLFINGDISQDVIDQGRAQYQAIIERSTLPKYGSCWKSAVEHINEGCKHLSEDTQSDIALQITNCFLAMSGHSTYDCVNDRKPNVRGICINTMSDRAFNVYTEFYTHTQNMCWFLRGQIWHETITENTFKVGKQLEISSKNQESLLKSQQESIAMQENMLKHGAMLEKVLEDLYGSIQTYREVLDVISLNLINLQSWMIGEVSWIDSILFYLTTIIITILLTSTKQTNDARLIIFLILFLNYVTERILCFIMRKINIDQLIFNLHESVYVMTWYTRYVYIALIFVVFLYKTFSFKDINTKNNELLSSIYKQNSLMLEILETLKIKGLKNTENNSSLTLENELKVSNVESFKEKKNDYMYTDFNDKNYYYKNNLRDNIINNKYTDLVPQRHSTPINDLEKRYNLRSRTNTPEI